MSNTRQTIVLWLFFGIILSFGLYVRYPIYSPTLPAPLVPTSEQKKAYQETLKKAEVGDPEAQYSIGLLCEKFGPNLGFKSENLSGHDVGAHDWFLMAANQAYRPAYSRLYWSHSKRALLSREYKYDKSNEIAESIKWHLLNRNIDSDPSLKLPLGLTMSESTRAEGERRAKAFRAEQAKKAPSPAGK
jgi:hypothetical protein